MSESIRQDPNERPLREEQERLLDAALGHEPVDGLDGELAREARALGELVLRSRRELGDLRPDPSRVEALRTAAREQATLTAAPAAGGFWRHLRGGLKRDLLIQVAAASLLVHLAALPVLAWIHLTATPERSLTIRFEQPAEPLTADPEPELLAPVDLPAVGEDLDAPDDQLPR